MSKQPAQKASVSIEDLPNIKRQYTKAIKNNKKEFKAYLVCGIEAEFNTKYAKYVIEYLNTLKNAKNIPS